MGHGVRVGEGEWIGVGMVGKNNTGQGFVKKKRIDC